MNRKTMTSSHWAVLCIMGLLWLRTFIAMNSWTGYENGMLYFLKYDMLLLMVMLVLHTLLIAGLGAVQKLYRNPMDKCRAFFVIGVILTGICMALDSMLSRYHMSHMVIVLLAFLVIPIGMTVCAQAIRQKGWNFGTVLWLLLLVAVPLVLEVLVLRNFGVTFVPMIALANGAAASLVLYRYWLRPRGYRWQVALGVGIFLTLLWAVLTLVLSGSFMSSSPAEWLQWNHEKVMNRRMWKDAAFWGMSEQLKTTEIYEYLEQFGGFVPQILFYAGRIPAALFLLALLVFWKLLWNMLAPKYCGRFQYQAIYLAAFSWFSIRIFGGILAGVTLCPPFVSLPFETAGTSILDSAAAALMIAAALRNHQIDLAAGYLPVSVTDFVDPIEYYDVQREADLMKPWVDLVPEALEAQEDEEEEEDDGLTTENSILVVRSGATEVRCKAVNFGFGEREYAVFTPEAEEDPRVFVLRHCSSNFWKEIRSEKMEHRLLKAYLDHEIRDRLGEEYEEL